MDRTLKKTISGLLALTLVIGAMPANSKGFFNEGTVFTAFADDITYSPIDEQDGYFKGSDNKIYKFDGDSYTEVTVLNSGSYGPDVNYTLYSDGTLFILGSGIMTSGSTGSQTVPYTDFKDYIKKAVIGNGITNIATNAFYSYSIEEVSIPDTVTTIGFQAFLGAPIKKIDIPDGVTLIDDYAFNGCTHLESVNLPCKITKIGRAVFQNCSSLKEINIPDTVEIIDNTAFRGCSSLTSVVIPNKVTMIYGDAFLDCDNLKTVTIPESVTAIAKSAFTNCKKLENVYFFADLNKFNNNEFISRITKISSATFYVPSNKVDEYNTMTGTERFSPFDTWTWNNIKKTATVKFADSDEVYSAQADCTASTPATYSADGSASCNATYTYNGRTFTNSAELVIPKLTIFLQLYTGTGSSGDIGVKLYVPIPDEAESADGYSFKFGSKAPVELADCPTVTRTDGRTYYLVKFDAPAKNMTDEYEYSLLYNNEPLTSGSTSVRSYAETVINGSYSDNVKKLCRAMLAYGGAAQKYFGYKADNPADKDISGAGADYSEAVLPTAEPLDKASINNALKDAPIEYYGMNLNLSSDTYIKLAFKVKKDHTLIDAISYINQNIRIDGETTAAKGNIDKDKNLNENFLIVRSNPIAINKLMNDISLNIGGDEYTVNVKQYMNLASSASTDEKLVNVCKALYNYYISTKNQ